MIPKIIHYCWLSNDPIPDEFRNYINGWKKKLYDYEFVKWDFSKFDINTSVWVRESFNNKKYAFATDYIRMYAVYKYGGIYMDMDVEVLKKFDSLLDKPYMFAFEQKNKPWIEAGCFGAEKGNELIGKCLDYYSNRHFIKKDGSFDQIPLPRIINKIIVKNGFDIKCFPWDFFTAKSYDTGLINVTSNTFCIHHFAGSWLTDQEKKYQEHFRKLSKIFGKRIAFNIIDYKKTFKEKGFLEVFKISNRKIKRNINGLKKQIRF